MRTRLIALAAAVILAIVGGVTLVLYVRGVEADALAAAEPTPVLVVVETVPAGSNPTTISALVELREVPAEYVAPGAVSDVAQLEGYVPAVDLLPGEQVLAGRFLTVEDFAAGGGRAPVPEGLQEVSIAIDAPRALGGTIAAGDTVSVWSSRDQGDDGRTAMLFDEVLVTATAGAEEGAGTVTVTLALPPAQVRQLVAAAEFESLWFSLAVPGSATESAETAESGSE